MVVYFFIFYSVGLCQVNLMIFVNVKNIMGQIVLYNVVIVGYRDVVSLFIKYGVDVNFFVGLESYYGGKDIVELLDNFGVSILFFLEIVCYQGDLEMLKLLLSYGVEDIFKFF